MKDEMKLIFNAIPENEYFARVTAEAFAAKMDPTMEELADIKTAVSEAVTNAVVHGYDGRGGEIRLVGQIDDEWLLLRIEDDGVGIADVELAMTPLYTTKIGTSHAGMGFAFMEAFMDELQVTSEMQQGTQVCMKKKIVHRAPDTCTVRAFL